MNKKLIISLLIAITIICGCGKPEEKTVPSIDTSALTEEDTKNFATGISVEEDTSKPSEPDENELTDALLNGEIEEFCPNYIKAVVEGVDYGEYTHGTYFSETCQMERGYSILLPADYNEEESYPVLYLLHGIFGDEYSFANDNGNKIKEILGNMASMGAIEETILVCPNMYATSDINQKPAFSNEACLPYDNFINDLVNDLMPHIESTYSVKTGRENTYLAGFSMGGRETLFIALQKPELFGYVCAISSAPGLVPSSDHFMSHDGQISEDEMCFKEDAVLPEVFMMCCGTKDSVVGTFPLHYHELFEGTGTDHIWFEITGADHNNTAIQSGIFNLLKQIGCTKE